jgi:hypothetical protein
MFEPQSRKDAKIGHFTAERAERAEILFDLQRAQLSVSQTTAGYFIMQAYLQGGTMTTVEEVQAAAQRLSPVKQLELIQQLLRGLQQDYEQHSLSSQPRILGLHAGQIWMSDDFNDELSDKFWLGEDYESTA